MKAVIAIPGTALLVLRAYRRKSLTTAGLVTAALTAIAHALYPSALAFTLLVAFFLLGTQATRVKHDVKAELTLSASGGAGAVGHGAAGPEPGPGKGPGKGKAGGGGEGPRTSRQVLANSGAASILCLAYVWRHGIDLDLGIGGSGSGSGLPSYGQDRFSDLILVGIVANYVSVTADTLSSELGILSPSLPRLVTNPGRVVPRGTNGGVTLAGIGYGYLGSLAIALVAVVFLPTTTATATASVVQVPDRVLFVLAFSVWGMLGSLLDSLLGALLQASVIDRRTGKVVEAPGGVKVLTSSSSAASPSSASAAATSTSASPPSKSGAGAGAGAAIMRSAKSGPEGEPKLTATTTTTTTTTQHQHRQQSRQIHTGRDILDNNQVNFLMASIMTTSAMAIAASL